MPTQEMNGRSRGFCGEAIDIAGVYRHIPRGAHGSLMPGWSRKLDEPTEWSDGRKLHTLEDAIAWLPKEIPKCEHTLPKVQAPNGDRSFRGFFGQLTSDAAKI
jgi:hypothetical protein